MSNWKEELKTFLTDYKIDLSYHFTNQDDEEVLIEHINQLRLSDRDELIKMLKDSFVPAESSRGQGGLPQYGTVKDWTITLTKEGFEMMLKKFEDYYNK